MAPKSNPDPNTQPSFKCPTPGCTASYRRKEHLRRHQTKHLQTQVFPCSNCAREFARSDTLRRHVWQHHKIQEPSTRARQACSGCRTTKSRCRGGPPCTECVRRKIECSFQDADADADQDAEANANAEAEADTEEPLNPTLLSEKRDHYIGIYFDKFHPKWPLIHKGSFNLRLETPLLVQSMVVLGMWSSGEESARAAALDIHNNLDNAIREQQEKWNASTAPAACSDCHWPIPTYQAILLHIIFSIMHSSGALDLDLRVSLESSKSAILADLVISCRRLGMFYYPNMVKRYRDVGVSSFIWVCIEEIKRFDLALYRVCGRLDLRDADGDGIGDGMMLFPAEELQFPLPSRCLLWNAVTREGWEDVVDETLVDLDDLAMDTWISNCAGLLNFLSGV